MKTDCAASPFEVRAADALKTLLGQVSAIKLKELKHDAAARGRGPEFLAHIDVHGHSHTLACEVNRDTRPSKVRASLKKLQDCTAQLAGQATPVLIAANLSPEVEAICKANHAGFLDLEGNGRLTVGEVFIGKRSRHQQVPAA